MFNILLLTDNQLVMSIFDEKSKKAQIYLQLVDIQCKTNLMLSSLILPS